jgi:type VII secretion protein EccE
MTHDGRIGLQLRRTNLVFLVVLATTTVLTTELLNLSPPVLWEIWAVVAAAAIAFAVVTYRSRSLLGWIRRRLTYRRSPRDTICLFEVDGVGISWDGHRACAYIEVLPPPFATTVLTGTRDTTIKALPVDEIREELVQFDIHCDAITIVTVGHNYHRPNEAATALHASIGPTDALLYGRTFIQVGITLADSLDSIYARVGSDDIPAGVSRTVTIAAERIRRRVAHDGWTTQLLTKSDLEELHNGIAANLNAALAQEHWSSCGPKSMRAITFTPGPGAWNTSNYREWCRLNPHRQVHIVHLDRRHGVDHAEMYISFLTSNADALSTVTALGLRREHGQQGDILTAALPLARTVRPTAVHGKALPAENPFPIALVPGGIGTFIGLTRSRAQVFVNFTVGAEPFYVLGPAAMCQQLLVWLSTSGRSLDITLPGDEWKQFAARIGATYQTSKDADIVISSNDNLADPARPGQVRLVWATAAPSKPPAYAIVAGPDECTLHTPVGQDSPAEPIRYRWSVSSAEEAFFTIGRPARRTPAQSAPQNPARQQHSRSQQLPAPGHAPEPPSTTTQTPTPPQTTRSPGVVRNPHSNPEPPPSGRHAAPTRR